MALKETCQLMEDLLICIQDDLIKAQNGNKAASQRVRKHSILLEKTAKAYRKESIKSEKSASVRARNTVSRGRRKVTPSRMMKTSRTAKKRGS